VSTRGGAPSGSSVGAESTFQHRTPQKQSRGTSCRAFCTERKEQRQCALR
jgi:hypothetical protein